MLPLVRSAVQLILGSVAALSAASAREEDGTGTLRPWTEYRTIMWIGGTAYKRPEKLPLFFQRLREMGINTASVANESDPTPVLMAKLPYYVENIVPRGLCLKMGSKVSDWEKHIAAWQVTRNEEAGLLREYSFDDPGWRAFARKSAQIVAKLHAPHAPLAYNLRDELSTTVGANPFDYDFSPVALDGFRAWLKTQYRDLDALNAQWETNFAKWEEVRPFTTDQIKNRMSGGTPDERGFPRGKPDWQALRATKFDPIEARKNSARWNFSPWCDHRTYMDLSLARTLEELRKAVHEIDPRTPVGIEGTQMPAAFGGYDLWRLSQAIDWIEPYDMGNAREIFGSFMPGKPILTTVGEQDAKAARRRLWHLLLEGDKGCIIWSSEDCIDWKSDEYALTSRARALAPVLAEMTSPLARLFLRAEREVDPIAIHYSQPSVQVDWLLESTEDGSSWVRRFSSHEAEHNRMLRVRAAWFTALTDLGYRPRFVSSTQIERGELSRGGYRALVMAHSLAVSAAEAKAVRQWLYADRTPRLFLCDGASAAFDEHGRLQNAYPFDGLIPGPDVPFEIFFARHNAVPDGELSMRSREGDTSTYLAERVAPAADSNASHLLPNWINNSSTSFSRNAGSVLPRVLPPPGVAVPLEARTAVYPYQLGSARLVAFERNVVWQMGEDLKQAGGNEALESPVAFDAKLIAKAHVYDLRAGKYLGHTDILHVALDPWQPALFAIAPEKLPDGDAIAALEKLR